MKKVFILLLMSSIVGAAIFISCKKEKSCESCNDKNKPPIANAGPDQVITLPTDSVSLDGSLSSDPDGTISGFLWTKISGPAFFTINTASVARTVVKNLVVGVYQFELKVKDNGGLSAKDTVQVSVIDTSPSNRPPVANAEADQTITLPTNIITLNGSGSTDPDNNITNYAWAKISGPSSFTIANASAVQTQVTNLVQGVYQFELKVTDANGLFSKDTMQDIVIDQPPPPPPPLCGDSTRPHINAQLIPVGTLSLGRRCLNAGSAGGKIFFTGSALTEIVGSSYVDYATTRADIYDVTTQAWSTAELSKARFGIAIIAAGNKIFFAGGEDGDGAFNALFSTVDIYDVSANTWS